VRVKKIAMITSRYPPSLCAMGQFAQFLINDLLENYNIETIPIAFDENLSLEELRTRNRSAKKINIKKKNEIISAIEELKFIDAIIINYVQYDVDSRAIPYALLRAIKEIKRKYSSIKIVLSLHEMLLPELCRKKEILYYPLQFYIAKSLLSLSDEVIATTPTLIKRAKFLTKNFNYKILPVFSGFGESTETTFKKKKLNNWVIFGSEPRIIPSLIDFIDHVKKGEIRCDKLTVFGGRESSVINKILNDLHETPHTYSPMVSVSEAIELLKDSMFSYIKYDDCNGEEAYHIFRSSVLGSCLANGVIPVLVTLLEKPVIPGSKNNISLVLLKDFLEFFNKEYSLDDMISYAKKNYKWYHENMSLMIHSAYYSQLIT